MSEMVRCSCNTSALKFRCDAGPNRELHMHDLRCRCADNTDRPPFVLQAPIRQVVFFVSWGGTVCEAARHRHVKHDLATCRPPATAAWPTAAAQHMLAWEVGQL